MPTSHPFQLNEIASLTTFIKPERVLEIGIGFGKYGLIIREYLEIWGDGGEYQEWLRQIDGIEIFENYILDHHRKIYDNVYLGNALDILHDLQSYDLIILIDVLEHLNEEDAKLLLSMCLAKSKYIIISTPKDIGTQGVGYENIYETHLSQWTKRSLNRALNNQVLFIRNPHSYLCLYTSMNDLSWLRSKWKKQSFLNYIKSNFYMIFKFWKALRINEVNLNDRKQ